MTVGETSWVVGAGITPFGRHEDRTGLDLADEAATAALRDAGVDWDEVGFAVGGSMSAGNADSTVARLGLTGVPFVNVFNGCATGGSALNTGQAMIESGRADLVLVLGFDKHPAGAFDLSPADWGLGDWYGEAGLMVAPQFFAMRAQRYMHDHGISDASLARVASKAYRNGALTPHAWRRKALTVDDVTASPMVCPPLRQYMFCSPGSGAVALVLASPRRASRLSTPPVRLCASVFRTRRFGSFEAFSPSVPLEATASVTTDAATAAFAEAGIGPDDVDVAQLQDTDAAAEILHMAETGLCADGEQEAMIQRGETAPDGRLPVNTDGGCIANGEPVGASGLRQVHEVVVQLRGTAGARQVPGAPRVGFTQVYGAPGVSACTVLAR